MIYFVQFSSLLRWEGESDSCYSIIAGGGNHYLLVLIFNLFPACLKLSSLLTFVIPPLSIVYYESIAHLSVYKFIYLSFCINLYDTLSTKGTAS